MHPPLFNVLFRSPLFLVSVSAFVVLLLSITLFSNQQNALVEQLGQRYGDALARLAAKQATDATLNHDLVSLHVIVKDIARNPGVVTASILDVENQLLVQAGEPNLPEESESYSAPITFQDNIAGYISVSVDREQLSNSADSTWATGLLGVTFALLVLSILNMKRSEPTAANSSKDPVEPLEPPHKERENRYEGKVALSLTLLLDNREQLLNQVSPTLMDKLLNQLERAVISVANTYNGSLTKANQESIVINFYGQDNDSTAFRALCAAQLLFQVTDNTPISSTRIRLKAVVVPQDQTKTLQQLKQQSELEERCLEQLQQQAASSLLAHEDILTDSLQQRLQLSDSHTEQANWIKNVCLQTSYQNVIDRQCNQLLNIAAG